MQKGFFTQPKALMYIFYQRQGVHAGIHVQVDLAYKKKNSLREDMHNK